MELVYAALLLHSAKKPVDEAGVKKVAEAAGVKADSAQIKALVGSLKDVNIDEAIKGAAVAAAPAAPAAASAEEKPAEEKKEEKESEEEQEKKAEEAAGGLSSLFG
ncbi:MAG: 50S ribosomal protein P1 [Candidatus Aenigmatarchaeota archaeon]|nr:MAG: 50S ribosomal protein P1 [Candidatus Aenigmarchaeota archaeon]